MHVVCTQGKVTTRSPCLCVRLVRWCDMHDCSVFAGWLWSPGDGGYTSAVLIDEVAPSVEHPAVVEGHEGVSSCGGRVLSVLTVRILQRGELVLPQHLVHNKSPVGHTHAAHQHKDRQYKVWRLNAMLPCFKAEIVCLCRNLIWNIFDYQFSSIFNQKFQIFSSVCFLNVRNCCFVCIVSFKMKCLWVFGQLVVQNKQCEETDEELYCT